MQVTINISDEAIARAQSLGLSLDEYLTRLVNSDPTVPTARLVQLGANSYPPQEVADSVCE